MDTHHDDRAGPGPQKGEQGAPPQYSLSPDQPPARDPAFSYATASPGASQSAAGADGVSPAHQGYGPDAPASGSLSHEDTGGLTDGFPPDDGGAVLWQGDLGVQGGFRTRLRVIGLEDGGQRARLLKELLFRPSGPVQEVQPDLAA